jgi:hypothetical protein
MILMLIASHKYGKDYHKNIIFMDIKRIGRK